MLKRLAYLSLVALFLFTTTSYASAECYTNTSQISVALKDGKVQVYQSSGEEGYVTVPKVEDRFQINGDSITVFSIDGSFSFAPETVAKSNADSSAYNTNNVAQELTQTNSEELTVTKIITQPTRGSASVNSAIPAVYTSYIVDLPNGGYLDYYSDDEGNRKNSVVVCNSEGVVLGGFYNPEMTDENGNKTEARFVIEQNNLILEKNEDSTSTILAVSFATAALDYNHFYENSFWATREEEHGYNLYLSIYTHAWAQWDFATVAWNVLADRHRGDGIYLQGTFRPYFQGNESGLHDQWSCHLLTVGHTKQPWNIEPGRPNVGLTATIAKKCNPY